MPISRNRHSFRWSPTQFLLIPMPFLLVCPACSLDFLRCCILSAVSSWVFGPYDIDHVSDVRTLLGYCSQIVKERRVQLTGNCFWTPLLWSLNTSQVSMSNTKSRHSLAVPVHKFLPYAKSSSLDYWFGQTSSSLPTHLPRYHHRRWIVVPIIYNIL